MTFYTGKMFPAEYRGGIFSAQHGSWNRTTPVGARVMFTASKPDGTRQRTVPFAEGWLVADTGEYLGRPVDVAQLADGSLLVSDDLAGAIYRISYKGPEPIAPAPGDAAAPGRARCRHLRRSRRRRPTATIRRVAAACCSPRGARHAADVAPARRRRRSADPATASTASRSCQTRRASPARSPTI